MWTSPRILPCWAGAAAVAACVAAPVYAPPPVLSTAEPVPAAVVSAGQAGTRLDHVPIAVRDLEAAVRTYRDALGFSIKPGRPHPNSVLNAHLKFADGSALELITASEPRDALAERYLRLIAEREGGAALALDAGPVEALAERLRALTHPFRTAEDSYYELLSFPPGSPLEHLFFIVVHRRPPDLPEHLNHANTAVRLHAVWLARDDWVPERELFGLLGAAPRSTRLVLPGAAAVHELLLEGGRLYLLEGTDPDAGRPVVGATVEVADLERTALALAPGHAALAVQGADVRGRFLRLPPEAAHGIWLEFLEPRLDSAPAGVPASAAEPPPADTVVILADGRTFRVRVEIADTPERVDRGLMEREFLPHDAGMLFLFDEPQSRRRGFWMYRTRIPLDVAFLDAEGTIVAIHEMEPCSSPIARLCRTYAPGVPYHAALEVNRGFFAARGIGEGARVVLRRGAGPG